MVVVLLVTEVAGQRSSSLRMLIVVVEGLGWVVFLEVSSRGSHHRGRRLTCGWSLSSSRKEGVCVGVCVCVCE